MSGSDCWNSVCFSCCRKADNKLADVILSGSLFQNCAAANGNAQPLTVDTYACLLFTLSPPLIQCWLPSTDSPLLALLSGTNL